MQRGLEGRRIALVQTAQDASVDASMKAVADALAAAGAQIDRLVATSNGTAGTDGKEMWHGARYAALVLVGEKDDRELDEPADARPVQLTREFLVGEKPLAVYGGGLGILIQAGGAAGRTLAARGSLRSQVQDAGGSVADGAVSEDGSLLTATGEADAREFATRVVQEFSERLEERAVDEMSEESFPASDPPAVSPSRIGRGEARE